MGKIKLALFASGSGSNALKIIDYFSTHSTIEISFLLTNKVNAPVIEPTIKKGIEVLSFTNDEVSDGALLTKICQDKEINLIILAGYLRKIPVSFINNYIDRIINIHPALLPKHGGKGMYGRFVHEAVLNEKDSETGITIHFVNEEFDKGRMIAQFSCPVSSTDTIESIQQKIQELEHSNFSKVIENTINTLYNV